MRTVCSDGRPTSKPLIRLVENVRPWSRETDSQSELAGTFVAARLEKRVVHAM
jgi:hypothetical protein